MTKTKFNKTSFVNKDPHRIASRHVYPIEARSAAKAEKGEIVEFDGNKYTVDEVSYVSHPEYLGADSRVKSGFFYQLIPADENGEELSGWINEKHIKKIKVK